MAFYPAQAFLLARRCTLLLSVPTPRNYRGMVLLEPQLIIALQRLKVFPGLGRGHPLSPSKVALVRPGLDEDGLMILFGIKLKVIMRAS